MTALLCSISEKIFITHSSLNRNLFLLIIILHDRSDWFSSQLKQLQKCFCWDNYSALLCNRSALVLFLVSSHRIFFFNVTWRLRFNKINKKHRFIKDSLCFGLTARVFVVARSLSLVAVSWCCPVVAGCGLLIAVVSPVTAEEQDCSWPGVKPMSRCIGRQILNHWTTEESPQGSFEWKWHFFPFLWGYDCEEYRLVPLLGFRLRRQQFNWPLLHYTCKCEQAE